MVAPGIIKTDFTQAAREACPGLEQYRSSQMVLGRIGEPADVGGVGAFLCADAARCVKAQRIEASGGCAL